MTKIAVILSGAGVYDGSEIQEAVLTLLAIDQCGASYRCFAPNINQHHVVNHLTGAISEKESRNVLVESARIARGDAEDINDLYIEEWDAVIVPGGFGAAKNLSDFAINGENCHINADVLKVCRGFAKQNKPAGYMCIAPALIPLIYPKGVKATIGHDAGTAEVLSDMGLDHRSCSVDNVIIDEQHKVVSTPAYMLATSISEVATGVNRLVKAVIALV